MMDKRRNMPPLTDELGNHIIGEDYMALFRNRINYKMLQRLYFRTHTHHDLEICVGEDTVGLYWCNEELNRIEGGEFNKAHFLEHILKFFDEKF